MDPMDLPFGVSKKCQKPQGSINQQGGGIPDKPKPRSETHPQERHPQSQVNRFTVLPPQGQEKKRSHGEDLGVVDEPIAQFGPKDIGFVYSEKKDAQNCGSEAK